MVAKQWPRELGKQSHYLLIQIIFCLSVYHYPSYLAVLATDCIVTTKVIIFPYKIMVLGQQKSYSLAITTI